MAMVFGIVGFLSPNKIATRSTAGLSIIFHHLFGLFLGVFNGGNQFVFTFFKFQIWGSFLKEILQQLAFLLLQKL